ncbi:hypothetical protein C8J56DRAFT_921893 [Mycena floridula]|nr:hypothetical protein C8J56DRAFT_921893 [Mycena floridula]
MQFTPIFIVCSFFFGGAVAPPPRATHVPLTVYHGTSQSNINVMNLMCNTLEATVTRVSIISPNLAGCEVFSGSGCKKTSCLGSTDRSGRFNIARNGRSNSIRCSPPQITVSHA